MSSGTVPLSRSSVSRKLWVTYPSPSSPGASCSGPSLRNVPPAFLASSFDQAIAAASNRSCRISCFAFGGCLVAQSSSVSTIAPSHQAFSKKFLNPLFSSGTFRRSSSSACRKLYLGLPRMYFGSKFVLHVDG
jgi:hypothetical protein